MNRARAFTLVELLVVLAIVALLVGLLLPLLAGTTGTQPVWPRGGDEITWNDIAGPPAAPARHPAGSDDGADPWDDHVPPAAEQPRRLWVGFVCRDDTRLEVPGEPVRLAGRDRPREDRALHRDTE